MDSELIKACEAAKIAPQRPRGMIISEGTWDKVVEHAQYVDPRYDGLMAFCGFKVAVDDKVPDDTIIWTDDDGNPVHVTKMRKD